MQTIENYVNEQKALEHGIPLDEFHRMIEENSTQTVEQKSFQVIAPTTSEMSKEQKQKQLIIGLSFGLVALIILTVAIVSLKTK